MGNLEHGGAGGLAAAGGAEPAAEKDQRAYLELEDTMIQEASLQELLVTTTGLVLSRSSDGRYDAIGWLPGDAPKLPSELDQPIRSLRLSIRSQNALDVSGVSTIGELVRKKPYELLACRNFGQTSLLEVETKLRERGLFLAQEEKP
jgi:hypothetical protein